MLQLFNRWKALPERNQAAQGASRLEQSIRRVLSRGLKSSYDAFKNESVKASIAQRQACRQLITVTMSSSKRMFIHWRQYNSSQRLLDLCQRSESFFSILNGKLSENHSKLIKKSTFDLMREKVAQQIFNNQKNQQQTALKKWAENCKLAQIQEELDREVGRNSLKNLERLTSSKFEQNLASTLNTFKRNSSLCKLIEGLYGKLQGTSSGRMLRLFNKWKNLPDIRSQDLVSKAANTLERSLAKLVVHSLKATFDPLKEQVSAGQNAQKRAIRELILKTMNGQKRKFLTWANYTKNQRLLDICNKAHTFFSSLDNVVQNNHKLLLVEPGRYLTRERVLQNLFKNMNNKYKEAFVQWREAALSRNVGKLLKRINRERYPIEQEVRTSNVHSALQDVINLQSRSLEMHMSNIWRFNLKFAFQRIKHAADIDIVKTYCNSIWKWKLSNVEARYYVERNRDVKRAYHLSRLVNGLNSLNTSLKKDAFKEIAKKTRLDQALRKLRNHNKRVNLKKEKINILQ